MFISVIVATYNRAELLRDSIESLMRLETGNTFKCEIIVVDNCSTDHTQTIVEDLSETVFIPIRYFLEKKPGVAFARNRGIKEASGEWVAFFDDDQIADQNWLKKLVEVALTKGASCVGGRIKLLIPDEDNSIPEVCRAILGSLDFGDKPIKLPKKSLPGTGSVLIEQNLFNIVGIFDEKLTRGGEDADLFRRIKKNGLDLWYAPDSIAYHIMPKYRLQEEYFIWCSLRDGVNYAYLDCKEDGLIALIKTCILRLGQAFFLTLPMLCIFWFRGKKDVEFGKRCSIAKAYGYFRETLFIVSPKVFKQERFFHGLDFRGERQTFKDFV